MITSKGIAIICGVSRGTVDRALNNRPGINPKTKKKVMEAAKEHGYQPHFLAQSLVSGKSNTLGVVVFDINNRVFSQLVHAIEKHAKEAGKFMYLMLTNKDKDLEINYLKQLAGRKVDGIAILSVNHGEEYEHFLKSLNTPIVTFGNRISQNFPFIWTDDDAAIQDAMKFIIDKGYERVIYVSPPVRLIGQRNIYGPQHRYDAFIDFMRQRPELVYEVVAQKQYIDGLLPLLEKPFSKKTAIFCTSDIYAINVMTHLKEHGYRIPDDIGVMGFDNIDILKYISPRLTTIDSNIQQIGKNIVDLLLEQPQSTSNPGDTYVQHCIVNNQTI